MNSDEFEFELNGDVYYISVMFNNNGDVTSFEATNHLGESISEDNEVFDSIKEEVYNREYEATEHSSNFEFYDQQLDHFGVESYKDILS